MISDYYIEGEVVECWCSKCHFTGEVEYRSRGPEFAHEGCGYTALPLDLGDRKLAKAEARIAELEAVLESYDEFRGSLIEKDALCEKIELLEAGGVAMRGALQRILDEPYGCPFCDSGKLRRPGIPKKGHNEDCGFAMAHQALSSDGSDVLDVVQAARDVCGLEWASGRLGRHEEGCISLLCEALAALKGSGK